MHGTVHLFDRLPQVARPAAPARRRGRARAPGAAGRGDPQLAQPPPGRRAARMERPRQPAGRDSRRSAASCRTILARFAERRVDYIVVAGGDGTVRDVLTCGAGYFGESWPPLIVVPNGKTNALAVDLGLPAGWSLAEALEAHRGGRHRAAPAARSSPSATTPTRGCRASCSAPAPTPRRSSSASSAHDKGAFNNLAVGVTASGALLQALFGSAGNVWRRGTPMRLFDERGPRAAAQRLRPARRALPDLRLDARAVSGRDAAVRRRRRRPARGGDRQRAPRPAAAPAADLPRHGQRAHAPVRLSRDRGRRRCSSTSATASSSTARLSRPAATSSRSAPSCASSSRERRPRRAARRGAGPPDRPRRRRVRRRARRGGRRARRCCSTAPTCAPARSTACSTSTSCCPASASAASGRACRIASGATTAARAARQGRDDDAGHVRRRGARARRATPRSGRASSSRARSPGRATTRRRSDVREALAAAAVTAARLAVARRAREGAARRNIGGRCSARLIAPSSASSRPGREDAILSANRAHFDGLLPLALVEARHAVRAGRPDDRAAGSTPPSARRSCAGGARGGGSASSST